MSPDGFDDATRCERRNARNQVKPPTIMVDSSCFDTIGSIFCAVDVDLGFDAGKEYARVGFIKPSDKSDKFIQK